MLALIGFLMIAVIVYLLIQSKATPTPVFVVVPLIAAAAAGSQFTDVLKYIKSGVATTMPIAILFMFSIIFFSLMTDADMFDPLVNFLAKKAGVELKELLYYCMPRLWALSIVSLIAAIILGIVII